MLALAARSQSIEVIDMRQHVWNAYVQAKATDSRVSHDLFSQLAVWNWNFIWRSQSVQDYRNRRRTVHLEELYRHMSGLGYAGTDQQRAEYLECLFLNGKEEEALNEWVADHMPTGQSSTAREHLCVGAKLHALTDRVDQARDIMNMLFELYPDHDTSIMLTVFRAHTSSMDEQHHDAAHCIYAQFKGRKGTHMALDDYDACLVGFLEARSLRYSKKVFRDMVKDGYLANTDTPECVHELLKRLHMLYRLGTDISTMTSIALHAITVLPPAYHGHIFGDWMKLAVVTKAPEAAAQILQMMFDRGCPPETIHFNLFLKALLRTKKDPNVLKAENIAWRMIEETRKAYKRNLPYEAREKLISKRSKRPRTYHPRPENLSPTRNLACANATTFALMMHHHAKKLQWEHVDYLARQLRASAIAPNTTIMNVLIDNKCRQGAYTDAFAIYNHLTNPADPSAGVFPNGTTFRTLWKTLRLALGDNDASGLMAPRELLREMVEWWRLCRSRYDADRFKMGLAGADQGALLGLVLHCFSYTRDLAGSLVALHVLRKYFGIFPGEKAAVIMKRQVAWIDVARSSHPSRGLYFRSRSNAVNLERAGRFYEGLLERRMGKGEGRGEWGKERNGDFVLETLSEFVRVVLRRSFSADVVEEMIETAAGGMGCAGMETGGMGTGGWDGA